MALTHAVLALLADGESYGYELRARFERRVGPQWGPMNIGHIYQLLDRLARDELVETRSEHQTSKPDRVIYSLTPEGRKELDRWLGAPSERNRGYRDEFFLKLMAASNHHDSGVLPRLIAQQRLHLLDELRALADLRKTRIETTVAILITAAELHVKADLQLLDEVDIAMPQLRLDTGSAAIPQTARGTATEDPDLELERGNSQRRSS